MSRQAPLPPRPAIPLSLLCLVVAIAVERRVLGSGTAAGEILVPGSLTLGFGFVIAFACRRVGAAGFVRAAVAVTVAALAAGVSAGVFSARLSDATSAFLASPVSSWELEMVSDMSGGDGSWRGRARARGPQGHEALVWVTSSVRVGRGHRFSCIGRFSAAGEDEWGQSSRVQGVCGTVRAFRVEDRGLGGGLSGMLTGFREEALAALLCEDGADAPRAVLAGVVCGYSPAARESGLDKDFADCGASHMVAVSGSHLVLIGAMAEGVFSRARMRRAARFVAHAAFTGLFVLFCGSPPSAVRAWFMSLASSGSELAGRRGHGLSSAAAAGLVMTLLRPTCAGELGFLLSMSCVAAIGLFGAYAKHVVLVIAGTPTAPRALPPAARAALRSLRRSALDAVSLTLVCQTATIALTLPAFGTFSVVAPAANVPLSLLFAPTVCSGALAIAATPLAWLRAPLLRLAELPAATLVCVLRMVSALPVTSVRVDADSGALLVATVLLGVALLVFWPRVSRRGLLAVCASALIVLMVADVRWRCFAPARICVMDVGQADAILVADGSSTLLVDAGLDGRVAAALSRNHVRHLDAVVLTHLDEDHVGGLDDLIGVCSVGEVYVAEGVANLMGEELRAAVERLCGRGPLELAYGDVISCGGFTARVVWPQEPVEGSDGNADSVVLFVLYDVGGRSLSALLTGDAEREQTGEVLAAGDVGDIDFLKVGHHGSAVSVSAEQAQALSPEVSVASAGEGNLYGHPRAECMEALESAGSRFLCTIDAGDVVVYPGATGPRVSTQRGALISD